MIDGDGHAVVLATTDQLFKADQYKPLVIAYKNGAAVRVSDVATVIDSVEDIRNCGLGNGKPAVLIMIFNRQPGANIIAYRRSRAKAHAASLQAVIPGGDEAWHRAGSHDDDPRVR